MEGTQGFAKVIEDHLELKRRNAALNGEMPLDRYRVDDPFENHPLFKSEEQARLEETITGTEPMSMDEELVLAWPGQAEADAEVDAAADAVEETYAAAPERAAESPQQAESEDTFGWGRSRDFDWGE